MTRTEVLLARISLTMADANKLAGVLEIAAQGRPEAGTEQEDCIRSIEQSIATAQYWADRLVKWGGAK